MEELVCPCSTVLNVNACSERFRTLSAPLHSLFLWSHIFSCFNHDGHQKEVPGQLMV